MVAGVELPWLPAAGLVVLGIVGLVIGSFLNVVIWRVPRGESIVAPPSACPRCGHRIRARDNVPVLSWLALRGRCRDCGEPISARYPLVELATGLVFVAVGVRFGWAPELPAYLYLAGIGLALTLIDLDTHRLPDPIVLSAYPVLGVLLAAASGAAGDWPALLRAAIGGAILWVLYFALMAAKPGGMGFGDVKLAGVLGAGLAWLGWGSLIVGAFAAFLLGGLYGVGLIVMRRGGRKTRVPFGPWMVAGAAVGVAVGQPLWAAYLDVIGISAIS